MTNHFSRLTDEDEKLLDRDYKIVNTNQRAEFRMKFRGIHGREELRHLTNSDLIYLNVYFYKIRDQEYTREKQDAFLREKMRKNDGYKFEPNQCHVCFTKVSNKASFWSSWLPWESTSKTLSSETLHYCNYFMDKQYCSNCMAPEPVYLPRDLQITGQSINTSSQQMEKKYVSKQAYEFLR